MRLPTLRRGRPFFSLVMVAATITVIGLVAFRFLDAQNNTEVANTPQTTTAETQVASVETPEDVETVAQVPDQAEAELDTIDAELDAEFAF